MADNWWDAHPVVNDAPSPGSQQGYAPSEGRASYVGPRDLTELILDMRINGGKQAASILNRSPLKVGEDEYQKALGKSSAAIDVARLGSGALEEAIDDMGRRYAKSGPKVAGMAIGPEYGDPKSGERSGFTNALTTVGNLISGAASYNDPNSRAIALGLDSGSPTFKAQQAARYGAKLKDGSPDRANPNEYDRAAGLSAELTHDKEGIAQLAKQLVGSKGTDADASRIEAMIGDAIHAPDPESFYKILHKAKDYVRKAGKLNPLPEPQSFLPPEWQDPSRFPDSPYIPRQQPAQQPQQAAMPPPQQDPTQGAGRFAAPGLAGAQPMPADAVAMLRSDTSKARRDQFDEIFGKGAAERALRGR